MRLAVVAPAILVAAAPLAAQQILARVTTPSYDGVVVDAPYERAGWNPSSKDIASFEKDLCAAIAKSEYGKNSRIYRELAHYKRQYFGLLDERGHRELHAFLMHEQSDVVTKGMWLKSFVSVMGGGDNFFHATRKPDGSFEIQVNAPK